MNKKILVFVLIFSVTFFSFSSIYDSLFSLSYSFDRTYDLDYFFRDVDDSSKKLLPLDDLAVSTLGGVAGMFAGGYLGAVLGSTFGSGWDALGYAIIGILVGPSVGSVTALNVYGYIRNKDGSLLGSIIGSTLGTLASFAIIYGSNHVGLENQITIFILPVTVGFGTTIGYNF